MHYGIQYLRFPAIYSVPMSRGQKKTLTAYEIIWMFVIVAAGAHTVTLSFISIRADSTALMMEINTASAGLFAMLEIQKTFLLGTVALKQPANICLVYHLLQI